MINFKYHTLVLLATVLVAGSFIVSEKLATVINPISLVLLRFVGAFLMLLPIVFLKSKWRKRILSTMPKAMVISFFYAVFFIGLFESLKTTTALNTGTLFTLVPFITALLALIVFRQSISYKQAFVYFLGITGTIWVIFGGQLDLLISLSLNSGDLIFMVALFFMSFYAIAMKWFYRDDEMIVLVFCTLVGGALWMAIALLLTDQPLEWHEIQGDSLIYMAYLIMAATLVTAYLYQVAIVALGPTQVSAYIYLNPALIALLLLIMEGESIPVIVIPGIVISIAATIALQFRSPLKGALLRAGQSMKNNDSLY